jgi:hypothetical protein
MAVVTHKGTYPHIEWIDLKNDGVLVECAIMKRDPNGNIYFFPLKFCDTVDKRRLFKIITNRNAAMYELWDLMSNMTLGNGMNSLEFFHQFVRVITPSGKVINPTLGTVGAAAGTVRIRSQSDPATPFQPTDDAGDPNAPPTDDQIEAAKALLTRVGLSTRKAPTTGPQARTTEGIKKGNEDFT